MGSNNIHPIDQLRARLELVAPYPAGAVPVPVPIPGTSFFPGGAGLWDVVPGRPLPRFPVGGVMVLGHDFYSEAGYRGIVERGSDNPEAATWKNLLPLLAEAGLGREECFFTNAYMGLRSGRQNTGIFPGSRDRGFVTRCREFLNEQLVVQRPRLVLTLGAHVPGVIAPLSDELAPWIRTKSLVSIDAAGTALIRARFAGARGLSTVVVALVHPCLRGPNLRRRTYQGLVGHAAELRLLADATGLARELSPEE